ncbi:homeobox domain-containing protein [Encephalitozoon cuniculi EcunIII-L]|nr:homeobox domain-containing protein [Encephalitozoon cuniculi EcunIII-L]
MSRKESKAPRTRMTAGQTRVLMSFFKDNPFPSTTAREKLSKVLGVGPRTVQIWFQNQRQKARGQAKVSYREEGPRACTGSECLGKLCILACAAISRMEEEAAWNLGH